MGGCLDRGRPGIRPRDAGAGTETDLDVSDLMMRRLNPCPYFRRSIDIDRPIRRATLYATARGTLELEVNGARVGDAVLAPGWTDYARRIEYDAHDVTNLLHAGENVLGAIVGDGWYSAFVGMDARRPGNHSAPTPSSCASCTSSTRTIAAP